MPKYPTSSYGTHFTDGKLRHQDGSYTSDYTVQWLLEADVLCLAQVGGYDEEANGTWGRVRLLSPPILESGKEGAQGRTTV